MTYPNKLTRVYQIIIRCPDPTPNVLYHAPFSDKNPPQIDCGSDEVSLLIYTS
jgi:hypothetical protein